MVLREIFDRLHVDRTLAYALAMRIWQALSGPITIALVIKTLSKDETGVYVGLVSFIAIQSLFELGLLNVLIGHAGHAWAAVRSAKESDNDEKQQAADARLHHLIDASSRWFACAGVLFTFVAIVIGYFTFTNSTTTANWLMPLLVTIPIVGVSVYFSPSVAILEGSGDRELVYRFRFYQRFVGSFAVWTALIFGLGVWSIAVSALVQLIWGAFLLFVQRGDFFRRFRSSPLSASEFSWAQDVVPAQWRAAAISVLYHVATQLFAVILLNFHTSEEAGRLGLTLQATTAIQMLALAWVQTKFSIISEQHGSGQRELAGTVWRKITVISTALLLIAFVALSCALMGLPAIETLMIQWGLGEKDLVGRFITPTQCLILGVGCLANHLQASQALYVLSRKANPLVGASVVGMIVTGMAVWIGGYFYAIDGILIGYSAGMALISLPLHTWAYQQFRQRG